MVGRRNSTTITLIGTDAQEFPLGPALANLGESQCKITVKALNVSGDEIIPSQGKLRAWVKPAGGSQELEADKDLDLATGEFYRPFQVKTEFFKFQHVDPDPAVDLLEITIAVV